MECNGKAARAFHALLFLCLMPLQSIAETVEGQKMAVKILKKAEAGTAVETTAKTKPEKKTPGQAKRLPIDGLNFEQPQRLRVGHLLSLFQISAPQFYKMRIAGKIPEPAGYFGTGVRPTPFWLTTQIRPFITGEVSNG